MIPPVSSRCYRSASFFYLVASLLLLTACGFGPADLARPNGVAVAPDGTFYVMDRGNYRVAHLSPAGELLDSFGQLGAGPADLYSGWDIALDSAGNVYVCNLIFSEEGSFLVHDGVKVFSPTGQFLRELGGQDYPLNNDVPRHTPYGLDIDAGDRVYVADFGTNTVRVFDPQGRQLARLFGQFGQAAGEFDGLIDVAVDEKNSRLVVSDQFNSRIQVFDLETGPAGDLTATHRRTIGGYGREPGEFAYPQNITFDHSQARLYVADVANRRIQMLDPAGRPAGELATGQDWQVLGLGLGPDGGVYAADSLNNTIWIFEPEGGRRQVKVAR